MKTYKLNGETYKYICNVNQRILTVAEELGELLNDISGIRNEIYELAEISLEMGQDMEFALIDRKDKIEELKEKVAGLRAKKIKEGK
jgi:hypothetical protein